jgi:hypothetical protein
MRWQKVKSQNHSLDVECVILVLATMAGLKLAVYCPGRDQFIGQ